MDRRYMQFPRISDQEAVLWSGKMLISRGWTKRQFAIDYLVRAVPPTDKEAHSWCAVGALVRGASDLGLIGQGIVSDASHFLLQAIPHAEGELYLQNVFSYNDSRTNVGEVQEWFDKAIDLVRSDNEVSTSAES